MKSLQLIFFFSFLPLLANSQTYQKGDTLFVWSIDGTPVFAEPSVNSTLLDTLDHSASIIAQSSQTEENVDEVKLTDNFSLKGHWVKISNEEVNGYVFDADLSTKRVPINTDQRDWDIFQKSFLGPKIKYEEIERSLKNEGSNYKIVDEVSTYENGTYTFTASEGCFHHVLNLDKITFNEMYQLMMNTYLTRNGSFEERPLFKQSDNGTFTFSGTDATLEIIIIIQQDGSIELSSYDCT